MINFTHQEERERTQISKIRSEKEVTSDSIEIPRILTDYYEQLYANKMDNLEEMDSFLARYSLPRLNQEEIENMNRQIISTEIESMIKNFPTNKSPGPDGFTGEFYQTSGEKLTHILLKLFQKVSEEGKLSNLFHEDTITLTPKPDKDTSKKDKNTTKKENY